MKINIVVDITTGENAGAFHEAVTNRYQSNILLVDVRDENGVRKPIDADELDRLKASLERVEAIRQACGHEAKVKSAEVSIYVYDEFKELFDLMAGRRYELPIQIGIHKGYDSMTDIAGLASWIAENAEAIDKWLVGEQEKFEAGDTAIGNDDWEWEFNRMLWHQDSEMLA